MKAILALGNEDTFASQGDGGIRGIGDIGEKHALPNRAALGTVHILHVKHILRKSFIENSRLDLIRNLRSFELIFEVSQRSERPWRQIKSVAQSQKPSAHDKNRQPPAKVPHPHPTGSHGGNFAIGGQPTQSDQNSHQHTHGNGVGESEGDSVKENLGYAGQRGAGPHDQFQNSSQAARKQNEGEYGGADEGVRGYFTEYVAGENPHGRRV